LTLVAGFNTHNPFDFDLKLYVPAGDHQISMTFAPNTGEGRRVVLVDSHGTVLDTADVTPASQDRTLDASFTAVPQQGEILTLQFRAAPGASVEDFIVESLTGIPPLFAFDTDGLLKEL
jgi:hypothetical protein